MYLKAKIQHLKITLKVVSEWLKEQSSYQLNQEDNNNKNGEFLPIYSEIPFNFQIDLTFFPDIVTRIMDILFFYGYKREC